MVPCVQAVTMVRERLAKGEEPDAICRALCDHCMAPNTDVRSPPACSAPDPGLPRLGSVQSCTVAMTALIRPGSLGSAGDHCSVACTSCHQREGAAGGRQGLR